MTVSLKRAFDVAGATAGLIVSTPVIAGLAVTMAIVNRSNPFFRQERIGKDGKPFEMIKIKTMRDEFDRAGAPLPDDVRTSKLGILIRKTRLDELPQFINLIHGEMSIIGPRPLTAA
jgi:undecaprenyl phosphate N,N'-diacetylbacillosamine 1-phosphate transferase